MQCARMRSDQHSGGPHIIWLYDISTLAPLNNTTSDYLHPRTITQCNGGDLPDPTDKACRQKNDLPEALLWHIASQLLLAVSFLSEPLQPTSGLHVPKACNKSPDGPEANGFLHGDIKPDNVILKWREDDPERKGYPDLILGDFGLAYEWDAITEYCHGLGLLEWSLPRGLSSPQRARHGFTGVLGPSHIQHSI